MKESSRAKRMQRHHARRADKSASLNMVSLMDIFTILVFFLLVSAANSDILPTPKNIKLPVSTADKLPKENIVIIIGNNDILIQGKKVASIDRAIKSRQNVIMPLLDALKKQLRSKGSRDGIKKMMKKGVTIMGDKEVPYILLKKIMITSAAANFADISLAVNKKAADKS
ncbi:MAG TPA: biopolymer transporter ExbD [Gammaproteobacteria bacterium]|nr:biopolymer transporter ExbD [Gammaproteobacteria bacterium]